MTTHLDRDQLIRWRDYGTGDRDAVLVHLAACQACAADYAELVRTRPAAEGPTHFDPAQFVAAGYRVRERLAGMRAADMSARAPWSWLATLWNPSVPMARIALVTNVALLLFVVAVAMPRLREQPFTTLSGPAASGGGARLTVIFQPAANEGAMRQALLGVGGRLVSGPSALGVYVVEVATRPDDDAAVQAVIDKLRGQTAVVQFVEREP